MGRGYFGIALEATKTEANYGTLLRTAYNFGAAFVILIGQRFTNHASNTTEAHRHIPLYEYKDADDFWTHIPYDCTPIAVEITKSSRSLVDFLHPQRALYILGREDGSLSKQILDHCSVTLEIPSRQCLNLAVAGAIVMYDRCTKQIRAKGG